VHDLVPAGGSTRGNPPRPVFTFRRYLGGCGGTATLRGKDGRNHAGGGCEQLTAAECGDQPGSAALSCA
jgi:hypothetical protein